MRLRNDVTPLTDGFYCAVSTLVLFSGRQNHNIGTGKGLKHGFFRPRDSPAKVADNQQRVAVNILKDALQRATIDLMPVPE